MKLVHSVQSESWPGAQPSSGRGPQFLFDRPARELPTFPFKSFPLGPPAQRLFVTTNIRRNTCHSISPLFDSYSNIINGLTGISSLVCTWNFPRAQPPGLSQVQKPMLTGRNRSARHFPKPRPRSSIGAYPVQSAWTDTPKTLDRYQRNLFLPG